MADRKSFVNDGQSHHSKSLTLPSINKEVVVPDQIDEDSDVSTTSKPSAADAKTAASEGAKNSMKNVAKAAVAVDKGDKTVKGNGGGKPIEQGKGKDPVSKAGRGSAAEKTKAAEMNTAGKGAAKGGPKEAAKSSKEVEKGTGKSAHPADDSDSNDEEVGLDFSIHEGQYHIWGMHYRRTHPSKRAKI